MFFRNTLLFIVFLLLAGTTQAQQMNELKLVGKPEFSPADIISSSKRDVNGDVVAGLMFITDLDNLSFEARNGVVSIDKEPGQYIIYVSTSERVVTVRSSGFKQLTIYLYDVGIRLKSGQMWKLEVTGTKQADQLPVMVRINQPDAKVFIDGSETDYSEPIALGLGQHQIRIEKPGYRTIVKDMEVSAKNILFEYNLEQVMRQPLVIRSNPENATVFLDGKQVGNTPHQSILYPGIYQIELTHPLYRRYTKTIELKEEEAYEETISLQKFSASLNLDIRPEDARITLNQQDYSGQTKIELMGGSYALEVSRFGYEPYTEMLQLKELEVYNKRILLEQQKGNLQVSADLDVNVKLMDSKGKLVQEWTGFKSLRDLPVDTYTLVATKAGYTELRETLQLESKKIIEQNIVFTEEQRLAYIQEQAEIEKNGGLELIFVQGGTFRMGSTSGSSDESPVHSVTLSDFSIGKYPVTQKQWRAVMGNNPSENKGCDDCPVENVSWDDTQAFLKKLNQQTGKEFRLPTEAEWEYVARGCNKSRGYTYSGSNNIDEVAWYRDNSGDKTHPVGGKKPNELGIYDMTGNVWEWCNDWYGDYSSSSQTNPSGPSSGSDRVLRGGSWFRTASLCRVAYRTLSSPDSRYYFYGFRVVLPR